MFSRDKAIYIITVPVFVKILPHLTKSSVFENILPDKEFF